MKGTLYAVALLAAAGPLQAQLVEANGGRLLDYINWFGDPFGFDVSSDDTHHGTPSPIDNTPAPGLTTTHAMWSGWQPNGSPGLTPAAGIAGTQDGLLVEIVFLGETAGWRNDWGCRLNGVDLILASGVQTGGPDGNLAFGAHTEITLWSGDTLDFFLAADGGAGGTSLVFDRNAGTPAGASAQSWYGTLRPLTSVRDPFSTYDGDGPWEWTVVAFEDIAPVGDGDGDCNDFIFAFRFAQAVPLAVPEPGTYGLLGAGLLALLAGRSRRRKC